MKRIGLLTTCCLLLMAWGCQQSDTSAPEPSSSRHVTKVSAAESKLPKVEPSGATKTDAKKPEPSERDLGKDPQQEEKVDGTSSQDSQEESHVDHPFEPPFGDRVELFLPPERGTVSAPRPNASIVAVPDVTLKGFAKVGRQRAVLLIGENVSFLAEGQEKEGVQVISIEPPLVTLQSGRSRWTVSLFKEKKQ